MKESCRETVLHLLFLRELVCAKSLLGAPGLIYRRKAAVKCGGDAGAVGFFFKGSWILLPTHVTCLFFCNSNVGAYVQYMVRTFLRQMFPLQNPDDVTERFGFSGPNQCTVGNTVPGVLAGVLDI